MSKVEELPTFSHEDSSIGDTFIRAKAGWVILQCKHGYVYLIPCPIQVGTRSLKMKRLRSVLLISAQALYRQVSVLET